jgi:hypothetical protein
MPIDAETRLNDVLVKFNELSEAVAELQEGNDGRTPETFTSSVIEVLASGTDEIEELLTAKIESYNESNEILNSDSIDDIVGEKIRDEGHSIVEDYMYGSDYVTADCVRDMVSEYGPDEDTFLVETESFFRNIISGIPSCWVQALRRICDHHEANEEANRAQTKRGNDRYKWMMEVAETHRELIPEGDRPERSVADMALDLSKEYKKSIKEDADRKDALQRLNNLENAKLLIAEDEKTVNEGDLVNEAP